VTAPAVSVLMPVLNPHPVYFPEAVASVLNQTFADFELVIVEDPSLPPEASAAKLLKPFADARIRHICNDTRTGLIAQRNRTLAEARADLVAMLDADDIMEPDRLAKQVAFLRDHPDVTLVGCQLRVIDGSGTEIGFRVYPTDHDAILRVMPSYNAVPQPGATVRKRAMLDAAGYGFEFPAEDYDLWSRLLRAGHRFANHPDALIRYRTTGASKSDKLRRLIRLTREVKRRHWADRMTLRDRGRYWAEWALLGLPAGWVNWLFRRTQYSKPKPPATPTTAASTPESSAPGPAGSAAASGTRSPT
jgi:glycosyltransferase involved in cell wall biosynthesis